MVVKIFNVNFHIISINPSDKSKGFHMIGLTFVTPLTDFWFGLLLYFQVNSNFHVKTVSSPNHTFFLGKLEQAVNQYFVHILLLVTDNNPS